MTGFDPERFIDERIGHGRTIGLRYDSHGADWAALALPWRADLVDADGAVATGAIVTLLDVASSMAVWLVRGGLAPQATLDLRLDRLRAPKAGTTLVGRGACYRIAGEIAFVRGVVHDGDASDPFAHVTGSFMLLGAG